MTATDAIRPRRSSLGNLRHALDRVVRLPPRELATTIRAAGIMAVVESLIRWVPLVRLSALVGVRLDFSPVDEPKRRQPLKELPEVSQRRIRSARRVSNVWSLSKGPCLRRALVTGRLLRSYDPAVRLGIAHDDAGEIYAHAWVEINGRALEDVAAFMPFHNRHTPSVPE